MSIDSKYIGKIYKTSLGGEVKVLNYRSSEDIEVVFLDTGYKTKVKLGNLTQGTVKDRSLPSVFGVGVIGEKPKETNERRKKAYSIWRKMIERCYSPKSLYKNPTYSDCTVSDYFKNFANFYEWCETQVGFSVAGFALDKDILIKGNKVYSENTCCFVPAQINNLIVKADKLRGGLPVGVYYSKDDNKYRAEVSLDGKGKHLGGFDTPEDAFRTYKVVKEAHINEMANRWKDQIDSRVYKALIDWEVSIND